MTTLENGKRSAWDERPHRFIGIMRIKNEDRWIARVIEAQLPLCDRVYIFDDHSTDRTREICREFPKVVLVKSPFEGLDESRDKQHILGRAYEDLAPEELGAEARVWALALDGDEVLEADAPDKLRKAVQGKGDVYSLRILYLWDDPGRVRIDGVYRRFYRPSLFRMINPGFRYQATPFGNGANFHCSSIPQEYLGQSAPCEARVLHLGYLHREDRLKKFEWYNRIDPNNRGEDGYAHMVMGDLPQFPAGEKRMHAGPMKFARLEEV